MSADQSPKDGRQALATPATVRYAGVLVGVEALAALVFSAALVVRGATADVPPGVVFGQAGLFVLVGAGLAAVARGLVIGRRWARTPAIVTQLLLMPVIFTAIGPSRQVVFGVVAAVVVVGCLVLLLSEASRLWSMDPPDGYR